MSIADDDPQDPPTIFCLSMTATEDKVLRELYRNSGKMNSDDLRAGLALTECADNVYGALAALRELRYVETGQIEWEWKYNYRPFPVTLTERGRRHVETMPPVRVGWTRVFLMLVLSGGLLALIQSVYREPDYGPIGLSMLVAGVLMLVGRRAGLILMQKRKKV